LNNDIITERPERTKRLERGRLVSSKSSLDLSNDRKGRMAVLDSSIKSASGFMFYMVILWSSIEEQSLLRLS
jgi:hypothetical protein